MSEEIKQDNNKSNGDKTVGGELKNNDKVAAVKSAAKPVREGRRKDKRQFGGRGKGDDKREEYEQKMIEIARVTRVMAGGKRMRFRACVAVGNKKGKVAIGLAKGADVTMAVTKAVNKAKKNFTDVPITNETIPHEIYQKYGAAKILFKPAKKGRGIIAGGAVRIVLELAGVKNVTSKILGTSSKINNVKCTILALENLQRAEVKAAKPAVETSKE